ncbi:MAG: acetyl-CoA synthase subunit gamma [Geobacter sp.]|nr:acetyl-CoA synthase subunit gamma [Geobacter sp.]
MPRVATELSFADRAGAWKVRWGIGRMDYLVPPGLYAIGTPSPDTPVVVTANYKMSYDIVRSSMAGRNVWLLVLETFGINVWCAAGKGTFGTDEIVRRVKATRLAEVVSHRRLLLPILGAPGVAAHLVAQRTGFTVRYATIRAADLPRYLDTGGVTTPQMRELTFTFRERLVLIPVELVGALKPTAVVGAVLFLVSLLAGGGATAATAVLVAYAGAMLAGVVAAPLLLPWLPGQGFALKGAFAGLAWSLAWYLAAGGSHWGVPATLAAFLALPAVSSFHALNFTGCSTYTSRSGVKMEMRLSLPLMGGAVAAGLLLLVAGRFF